MGGIHHLDIQGVIYGRYTPPRVYLRRRDRGIHHLGYTLGGETGRLYTTGYTLGGETGRLPTSGYTLVGEA